MKVRALALVMTMAATAPARFALAGDSEPPGESETPDPSPLGEVPAPAAARPAGEAPPTNAAASGTSLPAVPDVNASFGAAGQITVTADLQLSIRQRTLQYETSETKVTEISLMPAVDLFATPNLSFGCQLIVGYTAVQELKQTELGAMARVGYNFALTATSSLWPRIAIGYSHLGLSGGASRSRNAVPLELYVPIVVQVVPHFFIGGGPIFTTELAAWPADVSPRKESSVGLQSTIGGYFRGM
jgi:hypothetical protein